MRQHSDAYFKWAEPDYPFQHFEKTLESGKEIDVRVRTNGFGDVQMFIGVYGPGGELRMEEYHDHVKHGSSSLAMEQGIARATSFAGQ